MKEIKTAIREFAKTYPVIKTAIGDIELKKQKGEGGNGIVYEAKWKGKDVAIKIVGFDKHSSTSSKNRFKDEIAYHLFYGGKENGIVPLYYFDNIVKDDSDVEFFYYVMPLFTHTLKSYRTTLSQEKINNQVISLFRKLLRIIDFFQSKNIVHRDLKPENIFIDSDNNLYVGDFGIAWIQDDFYREANTIEKERLANYLYASPEQLKNESATTAMDIWAIGQIIQWFVVGETHRGENRKLLTSFDNSLASLDACVRRMLNHDLNGRIIEPRKLLELLTTPKTRDEFAISKEQWSQIHAFDNLLHRSFPKTTRIQLITSQTEIGRFFRYLKDSIQEVDPAMVWGSPSLDISHIEVGDKFIVVQNYEYEFDYIVVVKFPSPEKDFVLCKIKPSSPFFSPTKDPEQEEDCAGYLNGEYLDYVEFMSGYRELENGETEKIPREAVERIRKLKEDYVIICSRASNAHNSESEDVIEAAIDRIRNGEDPVTVCQDLAPKTQIYFSVLSLK